MSITSALEDLVRGGGESLGNRGGERLEGVGARGGRERWPGGDGADAPLVGQAALGVSSGAEAYRE